MSSTKIRNYSCNIYFLGNTFTIFYIGVWKKVSNGVGLNQYNPTLPHARSQAAGIPFGEGLFVLSGGCAR